MTDGKILELFFARSQQAIEAVRDKYGGKLTRLSAQILGNTLDAEECVNDALLTAWIKIPPERPDPLLPWLYATTHHISMNRYRRNAAQKRGGTNLSLAFDELDELFAGPDSTESLADSRELSRVLNRFLGGLSGRDRALFLGRYYSGESYADMGSKLGLTEHNCQVRVSRLREKLRKVLKKEGIL